jgi:hypothetical protein
MLKATRNYDNGSSFNLNQSDFDSTTQVQK